MTLLPRWIASVLAFGVFLALSFCGVMASSTIATHGDLMTAGAVHCSDDACPVSPVSCAAECLQKLDSTQQRAFAGVVAIVLLPVFALIGFHRLHVYDHDRAPWAPPWRSHRLFAFRE